MPDGVDIARTVDDNGVVTARYEAAASAGGQARPQAVIVDKENGTARTVLSDGGTVDVLVQANGAVVLRQSGIPQESAGGPNPQQGPDRTVEFDPAGGVTVTQDGEPVLTTTRNDAGDITLDSAAGRQIVYSAGGGVQQITDPSGVSTTATTGQGGVTVALGPDDMARAFEDSFSDDSFRLIANDGNLITTSRAANGDPMAFNQAGDPVGPEDIQGIYYPFGDAGAMAPDGSTGTEGTQP